MNSIRAKLHLEENDKALNDLNQYVQAHPNDPEGYFLMGYVLKKQEKFNEASEAYLKAIRLDPLNTNYRRALADFYYDINDFPRALEAYQNYISIDDRQALVYWRLADVYYRLNKFTEAEITLGSAIEKDPENCQNPYLQGKIQQARGNSEAAIGSYEEAVAKKCDDKDLLTRLADLQEDMGNFDRAIELNKLIISKYPVQAETGDIETDAAALRPYQSLSRLYRKQGRIYDSFKAWVSYSFRGLPFSTVVTYFVAFLLFFLLFTRSFKFINSIVMFPMIILAGALQQASWLKVLSHLAAIYGLDFLVYLANYEITLIDPDEPGAWYNLGMYYDKKNNLEKAIPYYRKTVELDPKMADAWFFLGVAQQRIGEFKQSELSLKKALQLDQESNLYWFHLGLSLYNQEMYSETADAARESLQILGDFGPALELYLDASEFTGNVEQCVDVLQELARKHPKNPPILMELGNILLVAGRVREAFVYFEEVTAIEPNMAVAWINMGLAQMEMDQDEEAARSMKRAIDMDPQQQIFYITLGVARLKNRRLKDAERAFRQSIELDVTSSYTHYLLGRTLTDKYPDRARHHMGEAIRYFKPEKEEHPKPRIKARDYEYIGIAYRTVGDKHKALESFLKALRYAEITPETIRIFSDEKLRTMTQEEFIEEIKKHIDSLELEVPVE